MLKLFRNKKGQNTAEYAILLGLVIAAVIAMQTYVKRGMQGGVKFAVDSIKQSATGTGQYEPYYLESDYQKTQQAYEDSEQTFIGGGVTRTTGVTGQKTAVTTGYQTLRDITGAD